MKNFLFSLCLILTSCGYHFESGEPIAISVPYVKGDFEGEMTDALAWAISNTSQFRYTHGEGNWTLKAKVIRTSNDRIGYQYETKPKEGKIVDVLTGIENRKTISLEVSVVNSATDALVWGPHIIKADATYDYVDSDSLVDLSFTNQSGKRETSIDFSLGQLDSVGVAGEDAIYPIYKKLAQKVIYGLIAAGDDEE